MKEKSMKKRISKVVALMLAFVMVFTTAVPVSVVAASETTTDIEWYNYRNNQENNGVTDRATPVNLEETTLKWAQRFGTGYSAAPTPPIIINGKLYIGMNNVVLELDKETGKVLRQSTPMVGKVGYATNPLVYADGKVFVQVGSGSIQAVDVETMTSVWHTEVVGGQTISPIGYTKIDGKGYVYIGTWTGESKDGMFVCASTDDSKVKDGVKELEWKFMPSGDTADENVKYDPDLKATLDDENSVAKRGFYWAGAYANEKYIAVGSDDGTSEGSYTANAVFYTLNPLTGDIIDKISGIAGDIRTSVVYDNGYLYFSTKGGHCYKVEVDENGKLGERSYIDLGGMTTASPVVYGNKIYIGVCGQGGQFDADGGHGFAVIDNSKPTLNNDSLMYKIPIKGYPQAAALVSTAYANEDFDNDGKADGRVYIYFTYNAAPGGIYYTYDTAEQTDIAESSQELFVPPANMRQYCISTICADNEGTLYYKNDSCYLMAVEKNYAYLKNLEVATDDQSEVIWNADFDPSTSEYNLIIKNSVKKLTLDATAVDEADSVYYDDKEINMEDKVSATTTIIVEKNGKTREYKLNVRKEGTDSALSELYVSNSNTYGGGLTMTEEFSYDKYDYIQDITSLSKTFYNVWPTPADTEATMKVFAGDNVAVKNALVDKGTEIAVTSTNNGHKRYAIYPYDKTKTASVKIEVTSEDGTKTSTYTLKLMKKYFFNTVEISDQDYVGTEVTPNPVITNGLGESLVKDTDYTVTYENNTIPGTAKATITGKGNYSGQTAEVEFDICNPEIKDIEVSDQLYTGKALTPKFNVISGAGNVVPTTEYTMTYENNTELGDATVKVVPNEGSLYTGEVSKNFTIRKTKVAKVSLKEGELYAYTGGEVKPAVSVYDEDGKTVAASYYTISYENNIETGTGIVTVSAKETSKFAGSATTEFKILKGKITSYEAEKQAYTGDPIVPKVTVIDNNMKAVPKSAYNIEFKNNTDVGTANFVVKAKDGSGYFGEIEGTFEIAKARLAKVVVENQKYTKEPILPLVKVYNEYGNLVDEDEYTVSYTNNIEPGQAGVVVKAKEDSNCRGSLYSSFFITKTKVASVKAVKAKLAYNDGKAVTTAVEVKDEFGKTVPASEYTVVYKNNTKVGKATATVNMKENSIYSGSVNCTFIIVPKAPTSVTTKLYGYDDVHISWTKCTGASGYHIYYKKSSASSYTYLTRTTETFVKKANLIDGIKYDFKIVPYYKSGDTRYLSLSPKTSSIYTLKKISTPTVSKSGTKVKVKWTNISGETGYQISRSTSKTGTNIVSTVATTTGTYKVVSATKGKTYFYKVRAYKVVDGKKVFGPWSATKTYKLK